ncbi:MAG TPA: ABC transporter permease [Candidatus Saccharimonadales bacterium]|jgi:ABC-2 type transport system permease protein|nr:ABC transporter permease [Candidatus Saccharimonadales bacterium]
MSIRRTVATTHRVLNQLRHDPRTLALLFIVPPVLITILKYVFQGEKNTFNHIAPMLLGIFPMIMMFLITSIVTLRERTSGTLDRLMTMPISKLDFILGYAIAFSLLGFLQALVSGVVMLDLLHVTVLGGSLPTVIGAVFASFLGTALGLFISAFARSEFQAVQFMPAFLFPQLLTCGLFVARPQMVKLLQWFADIMPLTYSVDAMKRITTNSAWTGMLTRDLIVVGAFGIAALILGSATIRRRE